MAADRTRHVVVAGGGFGGLYTALTLEKLLPRESARIVLVNDSNYMLYTPLLPGAAAGTLEPRHVVVPIREELGRAELLVGRVTGLEAERSFVQVDTVAGHREALPYDQLVLALGSVSSIQPVPGVAEHAIGFKTLAEAIYLRNHVIEQLEKAESCDDESERSAHLGFVFVGGGYAGVEAIAELHDFATELIKLYPRSRLTGMRWILVEYADLALPEIGQRLARFATRELTGRGIEVRTNTTLAACTASSATLSTAETVPARTLVWTAGVIANPVNRLLGLPTDERGRLTVSDRLLVDSTENIWALGDAAAVPDPARPERPCPPSAQHAIRQGKACARNVAAALGVGKPTSFRYKTRGFFVDMGRHQAVVSLFGVRLRGFPAWWLARTYHLWQLPGMKRKLRLVTDWTVGLFFGRDASELGTIGHPPPLR